MRLAWETSLAAQRTVAAELLSFPPKIREEAEENAPQELMAILRSMRPGACRGTPDGRRCVFSTSTPGEPASNTCGYCMWCMPDLPDSLVNPVNEKEFAKSYRALDSKRQEKVRKRVAGCADLPTFLKPAADDWRDVLQRQRSWVGCDDELEAEDRAKGYRKHVLNDRARAR